MKQMLQELFERECQNYSFYLRKYKIVAQQYDVAEKQKQEIIQEGQTVKEIERMANFLNSEKFNNVKHKIKLPENFVEFEKSFSECKPDKDAQKKIAILCEQEKLLILLLENLREQLRNSQRSLFSYIGIASDNNIKFMFPKDNRVAREIFILYYQDDFKFRHNRNVIDVDGCLSKAFMRAYMANMEEERKARKWFQKEAKKYIEF